MSPSSPPVAGAGRSSWRAASARALPPARLVWVSLAALGVYGFHYLYGLGLDSLIALPVAAVASDLTFQAVRFPRLRFPDAALATGLFLALILPPVVPLLLAGAATIAAVGIRHAVRYRGHPFLNPAATGVVLGAVVFGLAPAWWIAVGPWGEFLMIGLGLALIARTPRSWRIPVGFFVAYALSIAAVNLLLTTALDPNLLLLEVVDPVMIFFGLFMVFEPRTAPTDAALQAIYGASVGVGAAALSVFLPTLGVFVALLVVNVAVGGARWASAVRLARPSTVARKSASVPRSRPAVPSRWPVAYRAGAIFFVLVVVASAAALSPVTHSQPILVTPPSGGGGGGGGPPLDGCSHDNPNIPSGTLASLHQMLGPSVILSDNPNTGLVVFYDPVNHLTVTETDLYEDFGYAEFNGDDYAVSGCHP